MVTGSRAEYGLLSTLMREIAADTRLTLQVVATGMHLSPEFGLTYRAIESDGFAIDAKIEMLLSSDTPVGITKSIGLGVLGFADAYARLAPDIVVLLGDRYEILAAAQAAMVARLPLAHIHGGEVTEGVLDESIRHAITKMAHLHFVAAEPFRRRVVQMGEDPARVFNVGAPGLDLLRDFTPWSRAEFARAIHFDLGARNFLVTYHPVTLDRTSPVQAMQELLNALDAFPDTKIIFTRPNADAGGRALCEMIDAYSAENTDRAVVVTSLGQQGYFSVINHADLVVGNSSSGIIEVPFFRKPTVNIGNRQRGRPRAASIIDCPETKADIVAAIHAALSPEFRKKLQSVDSPYGCGGASGAIRETLATVALDDLVRKSFYDL